MSKILEPKVSVVTISFNQESFTQQTIRSVLLQDYESNVEDVPTTCIPTTVSG